MRISDWSSDVCSSDLAGVRHIVALRGDVPGGESYRAHPDGYANAIELVAGLKAIAPFDISVAAYPETHPDATCPQSDLDNLKRKLDAGATRAITQILFSPASFLRFRSAERRVGKACVSQCRSRVSPDH